MFKDLDASDREETEDGAEAAESFCSLEMSQRG